MDDLDRDILDFAKLQWRFPGARDAAIRERFDLTSTRYFQMLNSLIDSPEALAHDPVLVLRLRRMRDRRLRRAG